MPSVPCVIDVSHSCRLLQTTFSTGSVRREACQTLDDIRKQKVLVESPSYLGSLVYQCSIKRDPVLHVLFAKGYPAKDQ